MSESELTLGIDFIFDYFDTRQLAIIVWFLVLVAYCLSKKKTRKASAALIKSMFSKALLPVFLLAAFILRLLVFALQHCSLWDRSMIFDTILCYCTIGIAPMFKLTEHKADYMKGYFASLVVDELKIAAILSFILGLVTFNFFIELFVIIPLSVILGALIAYADAKKEEGTSKVLNALAGIIGLAFIVIAVRAIWNAPSEYATWTNVTTFLFPFIVTLVYSPFEFGVYVYSEYQTCFFRLSGYKRQDKDLLSFKKRCLFKTFGLRISSLVLFEKSDYCFKYRVADTREEAQELLLQYRLNTATK